MWLICGGVLRRCLIVVVLWRMREGSGVPWVLWSRHLVSRRHNTASAFPHWSMMGKLIICLWVLHPEFVLDPVKFVSLQRKGKRRSRRVLWFSCNILKRPVTQALRGNNLWWKIPTLHLPWQSRRPVGSCERVGELEGPHFFSKGLPWIQTVFSSHFAKLLSHFQSSVLWLFKCIHWH